MCSARSRCSTPRALRSAGGAPGHLTRMILLVHAAVSDADMDATLARSLSCPREGHAAVVLGHRIFVLG
eukprot:1111996-Rhodomonas_salina.1